MFYKYHSKSPWLKRVLIPFWTFQLSFMLAFISVFIWLRAYSGFQMYAPPLYSSSTLFLPCTFPLTQSVKQYQRRYPHRQCRLHGPLRYGNHTIRRFQAPSVDISAPAARQDDNVVRAVCAGGRRYDKSAE